MYIPSASAAALHFSKTVVRALSSFPCKLPIQALAKHQIYSKYRDTLRCDSICSKTFAGPFDYLFMCLKTTG